MLNRRADATERLLDIAEQFKGGAAGEVEEDLAWRTCRSRSASRMRSCMGIDDFIVEDTEEARAQRRRGRPT